MGFQFAAKVSQKVSIEVWERSDLIFSSVKCELELIVCLGVMRLRILITVFAHAHHDWQSVNTCVLLHCLSLLKELISLSQLIL